MAEQELTCREVVELVTDYLERALPAAEVTRFEQHLNFCDGCDSHLHQMRVTVAALGRIREEDVPPDARDKLLTAFREWRRT